MVSNCPPIFIALIVLAGLTIFLAPRSLVLPVFLAFSVFVGMNFNVLFLNLNFYTVRIFLTLAWLRVFIRREHRGLSLLPMDRALIAFWGAMVLVETLRRGIPGLVYGSANNFLDGLGTYFLFRVLLRERKDLLQIISSLAVICCVLAAFMTVERITHRNWLEPLGAIKTLVDERGGKMRCQATFLHPVLAGTFGAVILPLFVAAWWHGMKRVAIAGGVASTLIMLAAGSSGPMMTYAAVVVALLVWRLRHQMRRLRWCILITLTTLHLVMNAPVWALLARVSSITGGSGWHRFNIIDGFINHFSAWWLIGTDSTDWGWLVEDVANQYCIIAKHGGLLSLILIIRVIVVGFREIGNARREAEGDWPNEILVWAFGAVLFGHVVTFLATSYFDQTFVLWYLNLAMFGSVRLLTNTEQQPQSAVAAREGEIYGQIKVSQGALST